MTSHNINACYVFATQHISALHCVSVSQCLRHHRRSVERKGHRCNITTKVLVKCHTHHMIIKPCFKQVKCLWNDYTSHDHKTLFQTGWYSISLNELLNYSRPANSTRIKRIDSRYDSRNMWLWESIFSIELYTNWHSFKWIWFSQIEMNLRPCTLHPMNTVQDIGSNHLSGLRRQNIHARFPLTVDQTIIMDTISTQSATGYSCLSSSLQYIQLIMC